MLKLPRGDALRYRQEEFGPERVTTVDKIAAVRVRDLPPAAERPQGVILISVETAARLCLERSEEGRDVFLLVGTKEKKALAAYAWETPLTEGTPVLRLFVWEEPRPLWERK